MSKVGNEPASLPGNFDDSHLRVSDRERDDAIELLAQAATDGRLTLDEYRERTDGALTSVTRQDLGALTSDLVARPAPAAPQADLSGPGADAERVVAIFGSEHRRGRWRVAGRLDAKAVFGDCLLDLRDASLHARVTVLDVQAFFGSVTIVVPHGVEVRMSGSSIFGSRSCRVDQESVPGAPVIQVNGRAVFGEIQVRHPQ